MNKPTNGHEGAQSPSVDINQKPAHAIAEIQAGLNQEQALEHRIAMLRKQGAKLQPDNELTDLTLQLRRLALQEQKLKNRELRLRNKAEVKQQRREALAEFVGAVKPTSELQVVRAKNGLLQRIPVQGDYAVDGAKWHHIKAIHYLEEPLQVGPVLLYENDNPEPVWQQSPKGLTATMLRMLPGGGLHEVIEPAYNDPQDGAGFPRWALWVLGGLALLGFLGFVLWKAFG